MKVPASHRKEAVAVDGHEGRDGSGSYVAPYRVGGAGLRGHAAGELRMVNEVCGMRSRKEVSMRLNAVVCELAILPETFSSVGLARKPPTAVVSAPKTIHDIFQIRSQIGTLAAHRSSAPGSRRE